MAGQLHFSLSTCVSDVVSQQVAELLKTQLKAIIVHCVNQSEKHYTPSDFGFVSLNRQLLDVLQEKDSAIEAIYPASSLQQGFIYHALSQPDDDAYRVQLLIEYQQHLHVEFYRKAWVLAIQTYPNLRSYFNWDDGIIQIVTATEKIDFRYEEQNISVELIQQSDRLVPFNFEEPTLLRIYLLKQADEKYTLIFSYHHIIIDGWSLPILLNRVHEYYQLLIQDHPIRVKCDQSYELVQHYIARHYAEAEKYWQKRCLEMHQAPTYSSALQTLFGHPVTAAETKYVTLQQEAYLELIVPASFLCQYGLTLSVLVQWTWHKLIQEHTHEQQTIVGTTVSGRALPIQGMTSSVGLYINTLPVAVMWSEHISVMEQLQKIASDLIELNEHSFIALSKLQRKGQRLFHSLLVFENYPLRVDDALTPHSWESLKFSFKGLFEKLDYPLVLVIHEHDDKFNIKLKYDGEHLAKERAEKFLIQFEQIFKQIPTQCEYASHTDKSACFNSKNESEVVL